MNLLDKLALKYGTDKSSAKHNYTEVYEFMLKDRREEITSVLEIGVYKGQSLMMWADYFPHAHIYGIDIREKNYKTRNSRIIHYKQNATKPEMSKTTKIIKPQLVIDDGSHDMCDHQITFELVFPQLDSGAMYVIEDLHTCFMPEHGGFKEFLNERDVDLNKSGKFGRTVDWLADLTFAVNFPGNIKEHHYLDRHSYFRDIKSILFFPKMAWIVKK